MLAIEESSYQLNFVEDKIFRQIKLYDLYFNFYSPSKNMPLVHKIFSIRKDEDIKLQSKTNEITPEMIPNTCTEYTFEMEHPIPPERKQIIGPSKLHVIDNYKFIVVNKNKMFLELSTRLSGFMFMDTFIPRALFIYEQIDEDVKLNIKFNVEFIKPNFLKAKIEESAIKENKEDMNNIFIPEMENIISSLKEDNDEESEERDKCFNENEKYSFKDRSSQFKSGINSNLDSTMNSMTSQRNTILNESKNTYLIVDKKSDKKKDIFEDQQDNENNFWFYSHAW